MKHTHRGNSFLKFEKNADPLLAFGFSRPLICPGTIQSHRSRFKSYELRKNDTRQEANRKRYQRGRGDFGAKMARLNVQKRVAAYLTTLKQRQAKHLPPVI